MRTSLIKTGMIGLLILFPLSAAAEGLAASSRGSDKLLVALAGRDEHIGFVRTAIVAIKTRAPASKLIVPLVRAQTKTTQAKKQSVLVGVSRQTTQTRVSAREFRRRYFEKISAKSDS